MLRFILLLTFVYARYQFFMEQDTIDVIDVPKTKYLQMLSPEDGPSYTITKHRHKYNCTYSSKDHSNNLEKNNFLTVSKDLLKHRIFNGNGYFGKISVHPMSEITLIMDKEYVSHFVIDQATVPEERFGENGVFSAKFTEFYKLKEGDDETLQKIKVTYQCTKSIIFDVSDLSSVEYSLSVPESDKTFLHINIATDSICMEQEEESGFKEINRRLYELAENPKTQFTQNGWQYIIFHKQNITQQYISTDEKFVLGYFDKEATKQQEFNIVHRFKPSDPEDTYLNLVFSGGDECGTAGFNRTANLHLICPSGSGVMSDLAIESSHCHYEIYSTSPWVCNLPWMKKVQRPKRYVVCYDMDENNSLNNDEE